MGRMLSVSFALLLAACAGGGESSGPPNDGGLRGAGGLAGAAGSSGTGAHGGSAGTGGTAGGGGLGGAGGTAGAGGMAGAGNACNDPGPEPNPSEALASPACGTTPCDVSDCDNDGSAAFGGPHASAEGVVGPEDVDFLSFHGQDKLGLCTVNAVATSKDTGFRLCAFVACDKSATNFKGCVQGTVATSPNALPGCCTTAPGTVEINHDCTSSVTDDDSATIFVRLDQATACTPYTVDYHF